MGMSTWFTIEGSFITFAILSLLRATLLFAFLFTTYQKTRNTRYEKLANIPLIPLFVFGYVYDVFLNIVVFTPLFLELPKEWTVTERMSRHIYSGDIDSWRTKISVSFCAVLQKFDERHCWQKGISPQEVLAAWRTRK